MPAATAVELHDLIELDPYGIDPLARCGAAYCAAFAVGTADRSSHYVHNSGVLAGSGYEDEAVPDRLLEGHPCQVECDSDGVEYAAGDQQRDHRRRQACAPVSLPPA